MFVICAGDIRLNWAEVIAMKDLKTTIISSFVIIAIAFPQWSTDPASPQSLGSGIQAQLAPTPDGGCYVAWLGDGNNYPIYLLK